MSYFKYSPGSDTIRQFPENYCVAILHGHVWHVDADMAISEDRAVKIFKFVRQNHLLDGKTLTHYLNIHFEYPPGGE